MHSEKKILADLLDVVHEKRALSQAEAEAILHETHLDLQALLALAEIPRRKYFASRVLIHILNNVQNGHCSEDCAYCAQRKDAEESVPSYGLKDEEEILAEAQEAKDSGAYRYCLVASGRGPTSGMAARLAKIVRRIKDEFNLEVCLSSGIIQDPEIAAELARAGLDRYNHNLNASARMYDKICTTHAYRDRIDTLQVMHKAGISLCSGVILGMGETSLDRIATAFELQSLGVASIPVNFFLPVPGHKIEPSSDLNAASCLRILILFRLANPKAEIRMAAGREVYLAERQPEALRVANSLFVSGYLNVSGSDARETVSMILKSGYEPAGDLSRYEVHATLESDENTDTMVESAAGNGDEPSSVLHMKTIEQLRPTK